MWWVVFPYVAVVAALEAWTYMTTGITGRWTGTPLVKRLGLGVVAALVIVWGARFLGALGGPVVI